MTIGQEGERNKDLKEQKKVAKTCFSPFSEANFKFKGCETLVQRNGTLVYFPSACYGIWLTINPNESPGASW